MATTTNNTSAHGNLSNESRSAADSTNPAGTVEHSQNDGDPAKAPVQTPSQTGLQSPKETLPATRNPILESGSYIIQSCRWSGGEQPSVTTGSILSQSLQKLLLAQNPDKYAGDISLGHLRKLVPGMSSYSKFHKFCTSSGVIVADEAISFAEYLDLDALVKPPTAETASTDKTKPSAEPAKKAAETDGAQPGDKVESTESAGGDNKKPADATTKDHISGKELLKSDGAAKVTTSEIGDGEKQSSTKEPTKSEQDDKAAGHGDTTKDKVDKEGDADDGKRPEPLPVPKVPRISIFFRTPGGRSGDRIPFGGNSPGVDMTLADQASQGAAGIGAAGNSSSAGQSTGLPAAAASLINDATLGPNTASASASATAGNLTEEQWGIVLRNCAVFYGWKVDPAAGTISRAPRPAFQLRKKIDGATAQIPIFAPDAQDAATQENRSEEDWWETSMFDTSDDANSLKDKASAETSLSPLKPDVLQIDDTSGKGIPNYRVNDDSRIEVTVCRHAFAESLAKADFSSQSTEASVSGGAFGVQVGVSAGYAASSSNSKSDSKNGSTQTLVARYMYPRCDIFLRPEDLEPSPDFTALLTKVKNQKSIDAVRKIHEQFGQLFCQELTLGARLMSTKVITTDETTSIESQKEQFKVSVGISVSSPWASASVKHNEEKGSSTDKSSSTSNTSETNVFEATGGDTILANNPVAWAASVAPSELWRVINRDSLYTMIDMVSAMPGYESVQSWFAQAVPALSKYVRLDAALSANIRLKVQSPCNRLMLPNTGSSVYYFGFDPSSTTTPRLNGRGETILTFWDRIDLDHTYVLFSPATYRAPSLYGYSNFQVGDGPFGSKYNSAFTLTQWNLIAPFNEFPTGSPYELKNMCRVILRTVPFRDPSTVLKADGTDPTPPPSHMVVFRNAQGVLVPAISDRDEYQYWRIEKTEGRPPGEPIRGGDTIRLSWRFADQTTGCRDYVDDVFGRRRNQCPPELESTTLYLKVPWPRFEKDGTPTAMVMSAQATSEDTREDLNVIPGRLPYVLQDLKLRIDTVENGGRGDSSDYMLAGLQQGRDETQVTVSAGYYASILPRAAKSPMQVWQTIAAFGAIRL